MPILLMLSSQAWDNLMIRLDELSAGAADAGLRLLLALLVGLVGWVLGLVAGTLARWLLRAVRFNDGVRGLMGGAPPRHEPAAIAAWVVQWIVVAFAWMLALDTLGLTLSFAVTQRLADVLPRIVASGLLFAAGVLVAMVIGALTRRFFDSAGLRGGRLRGQIVTVVLTAFAALVALEQLGFAAQFVMGVGLVAFAAAGLALGLAFGLGCRDLARDFVVEYLRSLDEQGPQRPA